MARPKIASPKTTVLSFRVADSMLEDMRAIQERDGIPISEQARRGIARWLEETVSWDFTPQVVRARQDLEPLAASFSEPRRFPWTAGRNPRVARIRARGDVTKVATLKFQGIAA